MVVDVDVRAVPQSDCSSHAKNPGIKLKLHIGVVKDVNLPRCIYIYEYQE